MKTFVYRLFVSVLITTVTSINSMAQSYNHDNTFRNQFLVTETGAGDLTPSLFYRIFHRKYRDWAISSSKLIFRGTMKYALAPEEGHAESLDSALNDRMKVEAKTIIDRSPGLTDLAYLSEKDKLEKILSSYKKNIDSIVLVGGEVNDYRLWIDKYNALNCGLEAVRAAYMPVSKRKDQYLKIYHDAVRQNNEVTSFIHYLKSKKLLNKWNNKKSIHVSSATSSLASDAIGRWKIAMAEASK